MQELGEIDESYRQYVSGQLKNDSQKIADLWLTKLDKIIDEHIRDIFPTELLLDHIPSLINEIASVINKPEDQAAVTSSLIARKARELGSLRHDQNATVHQLLREYDLLAGVLEVKIAEYSRDFPGTIDYEDCIHMMAGMAHVIRMILQSTVDSFVEIYMDTIEDQTKRLTSFNDFISHELKRPLQAALLNSELMLEGKTLDDEGIKEMLTVKSSIQQAANLLKNVSELTELKSPAEMNPVISDVDVTHLVQDIELQAKDMLEEHKVEIIVKNDLGTVITNMSKLDLILTNLITNSIKYCDSKKDKKYVELEKIDTENEEYKLKITDNGIGIDEKDLEEIFKLHVRAHEDKDKEHNVSGHGLGLFLVREALDKLHGEIDLQSEVSKGTAFLITIPNSESI